MIYYEALGATKKKTHDERKFFNKLIAEIFKTTQKGNILKCSRSLFFGIAQNIFFLSTHYYCKPRTERCNQLLEIIKGLVFVSIQV